MSAVTEFLQTFGKTKEARLGRDFTKSVLLRGALPGAAVGSGLGALASDEGDRLEGAALGGLAGGVLGAGGAASVDLPAYGLRKIIGNRVRSIRKPLNEAFMESVESVDDLKRAVGVPYGKKDPLTQEAADELSRRAAAAQKRFETVTGDMDEADLLEKALEKGELKVPDGRTVRIQQIGGPLPLVAGVAGGMTGGMSAAEYLKGPEIGAQKTAMDKQAVNPAVKEMIDLGKKSFVKGTGSAFGQLATAAITTAGIHGATKAIGAATAAINRSRGYKRMMEIHPDLADRDEEHVKGMYNMLHSAAPTMAMNPYVAGGFVRRTEHASQYVDPKMIADLADAEMKIKRAPMAALSESFRMASQAMPGMSFEHLDKT